MSATHEPETDAPHRKRTEHIGAEVTPELKSRVRKAAAFADQNQSEWLRSVVEEASEHVANIDAE